MQYTPKIDLLRLHELGIYSSLLVVHYDVLVVE
jgi:hypothetical protein